MTYPTYQPYPPQPASPASPPTPTAAPYPVYPPQSVYNPWRSWEQAAANSEAAPGPAPARGPWAGRYGRVFAIVAVCVTVAALILAVLGPALTPRQTAGADVSGLAKVFDTGLTDGSDWDTASGCSFASSGLDVSSDGSYTQCQYTPSVNNDFTSQGFWLQVTVAPAGSVQGQEAAAISVGGANVEISQQGSFTVCMSPQLPCGIGPGAATGVTDAWHTDSYVANTIALRYSKDDGAVTVYVNGQRIATMPADQVSGSVALGSEPGGETLYTHAVFYSGAGS